MTYDRFDVGFEDTASRAQRLSPAERWPSPSPALGPSHEPDDEPDDFSEPEQEPEPVCDYWEDADPDADVEPEPEPEPHELWLRSEEDIEEQPAVPTPLPQQAPCEPLVARQAGDEGLGEAGQRKSKSPFIKGPLCREWVVRATALTNSAIKVGLALWFKVGVEKDDFLRAGRAESSEIRVDRGVKRRFQISPPQLSRGLHALKAAGLIRIVKGGVGRCPVVVIVNIQIPSPVGRTSSN